MIWGPPKEVLKGHWGPFNYTYLILPSSFTYEEAETELR